jgi:hypothetical protein
MPLRFILGLLALLSLPNCTERATEEDCDRAFDQMQKIRTQGQPDLVKVVMIDKLELERLPFLGTCVDKANPSEVRCLLEARTESDLTRCR